MDAVTALEERDERGDQFLREDTVRVEQLTGNPGDKVSFDVLMLGGDSPKFGKPLVTPILVLTA